MIICIFLTICHKFCLFWPSTLYKGNKNVIIRTVLQFPFLRGITSLCLGKPGIYQKNCAIANSNNIVISLEYVVGLGTFYLQKYF